MKYLKLVTQPPVEGHITFAYFGKSVVDPKAVATELSTLKPFTLTYAHDDRLGKDHDIPASVYTTTYNEVQGIRWNLIQMANMTDENYYPWNPHITLCKDPPKTIHVTGIESNDGTFRVDFV
jgi:hypothetical protein